MYMRAYHDQRASPLLHRVFARTHACVRTLVHIHRVLVQVRASSSILLLLALQLSMFTICLAAHVRTVFTH